MLVVLGLKKFRILGKGSGLAVGKVTCRRLQGCPFLVAATLARNQVARFCAAKRPILLFSNGVGYPGRNVASRFKYECKRLSATVDLSSSRHRSRMYLKLYQRDIIVRRVRTVSNYKVKIVREYIPNS